MATREEVIEALKELEEPSLKQPLARLGLLRDIVVRDTGISLTAVLHPDSMDEAARLESEIATALAAIHTGKPHVRIRAMTEHEQNEAQSRSEGGQAEASAAGGAKKEAAPVKGHSAGLEHNPLLRPDSEVVSIAIASGKGGVGKSTVTVNLAVALARRGKRVGLIDGDIYGFSVPDMMGIEERPEQVGDKIKPIERFGVKVISMGFFVEDNSPIVWRGPMLGRMLRNFFNDIDWGELDYLLLDLPPGTGDIALDVHQMLPKSKEIIVTTPHATAAFVAARAGAMAIKTEHEILGVVENMAWYEKNGERDYVFGRGGGGMLADTLHTSLLAQFPLGAPDNHPSEPDYSPSVYKADNPTGREYLALADEVIARCGK